MFYLFKSTWIYADKDRWKLVTCYILHAVSIGGELLQPFAFGMAVNSLQINGINNLRPTLNWLLIYLAGFFIFELFHRPGRYFECTTAFKNQQRIIDIVYGKLCQLPMQWHVEHHSGEIVNRIRVAGEALAEFGLNQSNYLEYTALAVGPVIYLISVNYRIAAISIVMMAVNLLFVFKLNSVIQAILIRLNESSHAFSARLADFISNIRTVITLHLGLQTKRELGRKFSTFYYENMQEFWVNQLRCFILSFGPVIIELTVIILYIWSFNGSKEAFLIGNLVMLVTYFRQMRDSVSQIASSFYDTMHWKTSVKSVDIILNAASEYSRKQHSSHACLTDNPEAGQHDRGNASWEKLQIKDLRFRYCDNSTITNNITAYNFEIAKMDLDLSYNSKIAIVGTSGSGKSTVLQILAGLYEPESLRVYADGAECSGLKEISDSVTLIPQDSEIFENTMLYNITFGMEADPGELERAIDAARFRDVIERLPNGINTDIREKGANLSGGEKQRLALARGLYFSRGKKVLLLDEITSSVDAINERLIMQKIMYDYKERCIICIIHRLHLLEMFDIVLVMEKGRIVQKGTFLELISKDGLFRTLWERYQASEPEAMGETG